MLREVLHAHFSYLPIEAAIALGELGALLEQEGPARKHALEMLGALGDAAREALPDLQSLHRRFQNPWLRGRILETVFRIDSEAGEALEEEDDEQNDEEWKDEGR